ncbi:hypothetical protein HDV00_006622 [Rhizophlyctis rosea]|nr:hypothetical protein HDV00_006622 [Rhizophlyctis rosea]
MASGLPGTPHLEALPVGRFDLVYIHDTPASTSTQDSNIFNPSTASDDGLTLYLSTYDELASPIATAFNEVSAISSSASQTQASISQQPHHPPPTPPNLADFPTCIQQVYAALPDPSKIYEIRIGPPDGTHLARLARHLPGIRIVVVRHYSADWGPGALDYLSQFTTLLTHLKMRWRTWAIGDNMTDPVALLDPINRLSSANANLRWLQLNGALSPVSDVDLTHIAAAVRHLDLFHLANVWRVRGDLSMFANLTELYLSLRSPPTDDQSLIVQLLHSFPHKDQLRGLGIAGARESKTWELDTALLLRFRNVRKFWIDSSYWSELVCGAIPQLRHLQCLGLFLDHYTGTVKRSTKSSYYRDEIDVPIPLFHLGRTLTWPTMQLGRVGATMAPALVP